MRWRGGGRSREHRRRGFRLVRAAPDRHRAADPGFAAARPAGVPSPGCVAAAAGGFPDHPGQRPVARRQPGNHGLGSGDAAGSAVQRHPRDERDDLQQRARLHRAEPAVRAGEGHRRRRPGSAGGDQCRRRAPAGRHAEPAGVAQGQPGGQPDHDPQRQLQPDAADRTERLRRSAAGAPAQPDFRGGADLHCRPAAPGDPHPGAAGEARRLPPDPRRPAPVAAGGQPQPGQGRAVRRGAGVHPGGQRPAVQPRRVRQSGGRLSRGRAGVPQGRGAHRRRAGRRLREVLAERQTGGRPGGPTPAGGEHRRGHRRHPRGPAAPARDAAGERGGGGPQRPHADHPRLVA
ncbi:hypothetical protein D3C78_505170 [compost metagenome]